MVVRSSKLHSGATDAGGGASVLRVVGLVLRQLNKQKEMRVRTEEGLVSLLAGFVVCSWRVLVQTVLVSASWSRLSW